MRIKVLKCTTSPSITDYSNLVGHYFDITDDDILPPEMSLDGHRLIIEDSFFIPNIMDKNGKGVIYFIQISDTNYKQELRKQKLNEIKAKELLS